jgi:hypothetical protein
MMQRVTRFPSSLYHFVWRNWDLVPAERLAAFLRVPSPTVRDLGRHLGLAAHHTPPEREALQRLLQEETTLAQRYYQLLRADSRLGFEASMQYFILPNDVREKILGLRQTLRGLERR